ncbi:MAG: hypothetical protein CVT67_03925 [Actinobacteria bacterium HGW-Actinobacteria-7]|jgi:uncharacterized membrane protein|nr:MAG: hypothetical protein CVT67_03925 [Actinobacteria bacterium HGW-Actinobacteria-7]
MGYGRGYGYGYGDMMGGGFGGILMLVLGALFVAALVLLVIWAVRASSGHHGMAHHATPPPLGAVGHDEAVAIAKRRLASGEITSEQYAEIVRTLGG